MAVAEGVLEGPPLRGRRRALEGRLLAAGRDERDGEGLEAPPLLAVRDALPSDRREERREARADGQLREGRAEGRQGRRRGVHVLAAAIVEGAEAMERVGRGGELRRVRPRREPGQEKGDSTSLQLGCSARARSGERRSRSRPFREMITRKKISQNEWKTTEI